MKTTNAKFPRLPATLVAALFAGILTIALGVTQPAVAAHGEAPSALAAASASSPSDRPTGRFLKQPLRFPPDA